MRSHSGLLTPSISDKGFRFQRAIGITDFPSNPALLLQSLFRPVRLSIRLKRSAFRRKVLGSIYIFSTQIIIERHEDGWNHSLFLHALRLRLVILNLFGMDAPWWLDPSFSPKIRLPKALFYPTNFFPFPHSKFHLAKRREVLSFVERKWWMRRRSYP